MNYSDNISFESIETEFKDPLLGYLKKMVGNPSDAEDILQETFIKIERGLENLANQAGLKSWVYRVATNTAIDFLRKSKNEQIVEFQESNEPDSQFEATERIIIDEMNECIRRKIDSLPPDYRSALFLHDIQGLTIEETSNICDISPNLTKVRIHRARNRLKDVLKQSCEFYTSEDGTLRCEEKKEDY